MFPFFLQFGGLGCLFALILLALVFAAIIMLGAIVWPAIVAVLLIVILPLALIRRLIRALSPKPEASPGNPEVRPVDDRMTERPEIIDAEFHDVK